MDSRKSFTFRGSLVFSLVCFLLVTSVLSSHFRGGIISWRAVDPDNFDGNIEITHRVAWRRGTAYCDANTPSTRLLSGGTLTCRSGCSGNIGSMSFYCTDYSVSEDWTSGERTYTTNIGTGVTSFEASFASCCWIYQVGSGWWEVRVKGDLSVRSDTGRLNTSPVSATQPIIRLCYSLPRTISIPVQDADGDVVKCRWASSSRGECAGVCNAFSYGTLDGNACTLSYNGRGASNGWYAVSLQIEDFATSSSTTPLSSVPLQFLVNTFYSASCNAYPPPTLVDTLGDGACVGVAAGTQYTQRITAQSGSTSTSITNIQTVSPLGFTKSALTRISGTQQWYIDVTWTPSSTQTGPQIFCYQAYDNVYQSSEQRCITLLSGVSGPSVVPRSDEVSGEKNGRHEWSVKFDEHFTRPISSASIKIYEQGTNELVESLDASTDPNVVFPTSGGNTTLKFYTTTHDPNVNYYVLLDPGVVNGIEHCGVQSKPIDDPQTWEAQLTCRDDYVYRYTDYTQGTCRNKFPDNPVMTVGQDSDPKDCSCPDGTVVDERKSQWTKWLNRDHHSGQGDFEGLASFLAWNDPPVCEHPVGIECRVLGTQVDYRDTGEVYSCTPEVGGICVDGNQPAGVQCSDYEVRFLCPCGSLGFTHVEYDEDYPCDCFDPADCPSCRGGAWGDPHYTSYDGLKFDLFDHCTHIFTKDCQDNTFAVYSVTSNKCTNGRIPTCIDEVYVEIGSSVLIHLYDYPPTYDFTGTSDLSSVSTTVTLQNNQITVYIRDLDVVVTFGRWLLNVQVSSNYGGKLCGLLGDCNGDKYNDMYIHNSTGHLVPGTLQEFEEEHRVYNFTDDGCQFVNHMPVTCERDDISDADEALCDLLTDTTGNYSACHAHISPDSFHSDCFIDACFVPDKQEGLCRNLLTYTDKCRSLGIDVGPPPADCVPSCPVGQSFKCGPVVSSTCQHPQGTTDRDSCVMGCYCNDGKVLEVNGECVDPADCIVCPFDHVIRFGLHPQSSCRNPKPENQTKVHGCFCPEGSVLNDRTGRCVQTSSCPACSGSASGDPHYITYDGYRYDLFDHCTHVFSKDCANNTFAVYSITSDACSGGRAPTCIDQAVVEVPAHGVWIYLDYPSRYTYTGVGGLEDVNIEVVLGGQMTVRLVDYDVVITFSRYFLSVRAPLSYRGKLCGLLGDCDGDMSNDFKLQNGSVSDLMTFEEEYRAPHVNSSCSFQGPMPATCDPAILSEAQTFCNSLIDPTGSYRNCHNVISPMNSYDSCVLDYCFVNADDTLTTVCRVIQDYADECRFHGIQVGFLPADCRPTCPSGQTFRCGPSIPQSCQNPNGYDDGYCVEGCYCNNGTILDITGECVDPSQCTVCPSDRIVRYGYVPELTCRNPVPPDGEERVIGCFCPLGYLVNDLTGKCIEATKCPACTGLASGDPHYLTYDGRYYDLFDHCSHLFSGDCVDNTFAVYSITSDRCSRGRAPTCMDRAVVEVPPLGVTIHLYMEGVPKYDFDGAPSLPANIVVVQTSSRVMLHLVDYGVYIWYGRYYLKVQAPVSYGNNLCGLLGNCNGDTSDDWKLIDGSITSDVNTLEHEYRSTKYSYLCDNGFIDPMPATCELDGDAESFCYQVVMENGTYSPCYEFIDPDPVFDNCVLDYCFLSEELIDGPCRTILDYADSCRQSGVQVGLIHEMCRPQCPDGQSYRCGPLRPPSCENPQAIEDHACIEGCYCNEGTILDVDGSCVAPEDCTVCAFDHVVRFELMPRSTCRDPDPINQTLVRGCFCPKGKVPNDRTGHCVDTQSCPACSGSASGDPHYITYDGYRYDLFDHCTHVFSKDCANNTFAVYSITSNTCSGGRAPTCIDQAVVEVPAHGVWIYLDYLEYTFTGVGGLEHVNIEVIVGRQITVRLIDYDVVITFSRYFLSVRAPLSYRGKLCGLLGDCDGDMSNDFKLQNGSVSDLMTFEDEYRAPHVNSSCSFQAPVPVTPCDPTTLSEAQTFCNSLIDSTGSYSNCHNVIGPGNSYDSCVLDYCFVNADDSLTTVCRVIQDYADECRAHGIPVGLLPVVCQPTCPPGQTFRCGPSIPPSCQNPNGYDDGYCVEGCYCNNGTILDITGECVHPSQCTKCQFDHVIRFGLYPQSSCRNPNPKNQTKILGCFCPEGSVLNDRTGRCVKKPLCPACSGSASGDPHYITYDGYRYDLFDHCTHVFSKDCANNTFAVYSITSDACSRGRAPTCIDQAVVEVPAHGVWIYLDYPLQYTYTGVGGLEDVNIEVIVGRQITVRLIDYDVVITFSRYFLSVRAPLSYRGKLCGLLGDCDGDMSNDFKLQNGSVSDLMTFEEEYRAPRVNSSCSFQAPVPVIPCDPTTLSEAQTFCNSLIDPTGSYSNCHDVISPTDSFDSCVLDYCFVNADDSLTTVCRVIQDYADECRLHQIAVGSLPVICQPTCSPGQSFRCGPSIPQSCQNPDGYDDGYCVEGCYCDDGTILDITGECVDPPKCTVCPSDRIVRYGYLPELTCRNPVPPDGEEKVIGCFCPLGYLVNDLTGKCIEATKCPACTGLASGDPHYLTYDGRYYDLFDHCSHLFSGDCVDNTFAVYSITSDRCSGGRAPTCIDRAVVEVPPLGVTIHLYIEGVPKYDFDGAPSLPANIVVVQTSSRVMLHLVDYGVYIWYGRYYLKVQAPKNYIGKLCGLLGDCNGYPSDDWKFRDGNVTNSLVTFEQGYRIERYSYLCDDDGFMDPMPATCEPDDNATTLCSQVVKTNGTYSPCHDYIDPQPVYDNCLLDYCILDGEDLIDGPCRTILDYADSCRQSGVQVGPIHEMCRPQCPDGQSYRCGPLRPPSCENPQAIEDHACIEGCYCNEGTILDVDGSCVAPEDCTVCVDEHIVRFGSLPQPTCRQNDPLLTPHTRGCFCPKDMVLNDRTGRCIHPTQCSHCVGTAVGDPHYLSHDGLYFDLFDHCTHLFTGDCQNETFFVYSITSDTCSGGRSPTCVDGAVVDIPTLGLRVVLDPSGPTSVSMNDTIFDPSGVQISHIGSRIMLKITDYDVVVTFSPAYLSVAVPLAYCGKLCGLVGNGNGDTGDDWLSRNGTILTDVYELEREYRVDLEGVSCTHWVPVMDTQCEEGRRQEAEEWCSVLRDPEGRYALCHPYISPEKSYENCVLDYCYSDPGDYDMVCLSLKNYADDCRANNLQVDGLSPKECRPDCLWDTEFTCGPVYPSTCDDPEGEVMTPFCVEGCFCKPGFLLDVRGDCVEPAGCDIAHCRYSNYTVDLVFAIDTSESYGQRQFFYDVLDWVAHIVHRMDFGEDDVRVGIVIFGSDILEDKNIPLDEYARDKEGLVAAIKSILWKSHGTEIGTAIDYVTQRLRPDGGFGARNESTKVAVFITDGNSHDSVTTAIANARREGVILHTVGAGESLNLAVLNQIADRPEYVYFNPWDHRDLDVIYTNASQALICNVPYPVTCDPPCNEVGGYCRHHQFCLCNEDWTGDSCSTPVCKPDCLNEGTCASPGVCDCTGNWIGDRCEDGPYLTPDTDVNIMIIIDTSEDFQNSFDNVVSSLLVFIDELFIGEDRTRVGVMLMGDSPIPAVMLNITSRGELMEAITQIEFVDQQNSNPAEALGDLPAAFTSDGDYGAEEADINMAFLFTDGDNTNNAATIQAAMAVGEANITMFVVGVGGENQTTEENRAGLEAIANATGGHSVLYADPEVQVSFSALIANLAADVFNPILTNSCLTTGLSYSCGVRINVSCGIEVWNKSRDADGCVGRCFCDDGRVMQTSGGSGTCYTVDEIDQLCPTDEVFDDDVLSTPVLVAIAIAALLLFAICILCPVILCLLWLLQRRRKKSIRNRRLIVDPGAWNLGRGRADWEDEEKLIKMKDEENELVDTAFQGTGDDVVLVNDKVVDDGAGGDNMNNSSDDVKGLGIDNPMFMENDPTEDDEDKEIEEGEKEEEDKQEEDGEEEQEQDEEKEGQEEGEGQEAGEEKQEEGEEANLIDFDEEDKIDGDKPKRDLPDSTKMSLADRIKLFHVGEIQKEEKVRRPPPKSFVGKVKLFEAIQKTTDPVPVAMQKTTDPVPVKERVWPPPATTESSTPPPPPANPPPTGPPQESATQMSQEALEKELDDIFANIS